MHPLAALAKHSVEEFVRRRKVLPPPEPLPEEMSGRAGVFVCIKKEGDLRGCIGTFAPCCDNVATETIKNAISAASQDPRFRPVAEDELGSLSYSVDLLSSPEKVTDLRQLDPRKFGVIVTCGGKRGLLLPDLEGVDSVGEQLRIARLKAGILSDEEIEIYRFTVARYR